MTVPLLIDASLIDIKPIFIVWSPYQRGHHQYLPAILLQTQEQLGHSRDHSLLLPQYDIRELIDKIIRHIPGILLLCAWALSLSLFSALL